MKRIHVVLTLVPLLILCGCGNYRELSHFDLAAGIAIDRGGDGYVLTLEMLDLSGSPEENKAESFTVTAEGETVPWALENARRQLSRSIHMGNMEIIAVSEDIARDEGLSGLMDLFTRNTDIRESADLVIARGAAAKELLAAKSADVGVAAHALKLLVHPPEDVNAQVIRTPLYRIAETLKAEGKSLVLPAVGLKQDGDKPMLDLDGIAVFQYDKLIGFLEQSQLSGYLYLMDQAKKRVFVFDDETGSPVSVSASSLHATKGFYPENGLPVFRFEVRLEARVDQLSDQNPRLSDLEAKASERLQEELRQTVRFIQQDLGSDILGLGYEIYLKDKTLWDEVGPFWESRFEDIRVEIDASVRIRSTGNTGRS